MKEEEKLEYVECFDWSGKMFLNGTIYKLDENNVITGGTNSYPEKYPHRAFHPSTKEAYDKQNSKNTTMKTFPITRSQFRELHAIACSTWKEKLTKLCTETIKPFDEKGELSYETVKSMFDAAIATQLPVVKKMFPNFSTDKSINIRKKSPEEIFTQEACDGGMINVRLYGAYEDKAFYLSKKYKWELKEEGNEEFILIPTIK